jgi:methylated-DNA-[protein]-cysteine S-methyltransferase
MNLIQIKINSSIGPLYMVSSNIGIRGVYWESVDVEMFCKNMTVASSYLLEGKKQIVEYLARKRKRFDLPVDIVGTEFQKSVWKELSNIDYGETSSYKYVASAIKKPNAIRAVGKAIGKNPLCLIVPCHRVIASDGSLGGYSGGLAIKKKLLQLESAERY